LLRRGAQALSVYGELAEGKEEHRHRVGIGFSRGRLSLRVDGRDADGIAELAALVPVHVIDPKLHQLIEAGPSVRRRFLDWGVFHVEQDFLDTWRQYRRVLGQRNAVLKTGATGAQLAVWTAKLVELGERLTQARTRYVEALADVVRRIGSALAGREVSIRYRCGWREGIEFGEALAKAAERERLTGVTAVGPHRADLEVEIGGAEVDVAASRGEQKLVVAALVLSQVSLWEQRSGRSSLLLIDDPAAELDSGALERLMSEVRKLLSQLLITGLSERALEPDSGYPVFHVEQGRIQPVVV
jgi:DNA replication and repair protein RecF